MTKTYEERRKAYIRNLTDSGIPREEAERRWGQFSHEEEWQYRAARIDDGTEYRGSS